MSVLLDLRKSDIIGIAASSLCAVHCAITPLIFMAKPYLDGGAICHQDGCCAAAPLGWRMFDWVFLAVSLLAVWYSAKRTPKASYRFLLWGAWVVLSIGLVIGGQIGHGLMYFGSFCLVVIHFLNIRHCKACQDEICAPAPAS